MIKQYKWLGDGAHTSATSFLVYSVAIVLRDCGLWFELGEERRGEAMGIGAQCLLVVVLELSKGVAWPQEGQYAETMQHSEKQKSA